MIPFARLVGKAMNAVSIILMMALCIPIVYEAIARAFGAPTTWVFETTLYAFIFLGFLGNVLAVQSGAHFRVTLLLELFPARRKLLDLIAQIATVLLAGLSAGQNKRCCTCVSSCSVERPWALWRNALSLDRVLNYAGVREK